MKRFNLFGLIAGFVSVVGIAVLALTKKNGPRPVHKISYASQPDVKFLCDESWSTPKWGSEEDKQTDDDDVHVADDDRHYTFEDTKVTCPECLKKL